MVASAHAFWVCEPSIMTSGSTIGTMPAAWQDRHIERGTARSPCSAQSVGVPSPIGITARHLANRAPRAANSASRLSRLSRPCVISSPSAAPASWTTPVSTLMPAMKPEFVAGLGEGPPVGQLLTERLFAEDHAADSAEQVRSGDQQLAVGAAVLLGGLDPRTLEPLGHRRGALVGGEDAATVADDLQDAVTRRSWSKLSLPSGAPAPVRAWTLSVQRGPVRPPYGWRGGVSRADPDST